MGESLFRPGLFEPAAKRIFQSLILVQDAGSGRNTSKRCWVYDTPRNTTGKMDGVN